MDRLKALMDLQSTTCVCNRSKQRKESFCSTCYYALPAQMRFALYRKFGQGYEGAYETALDYLAKRRQRLAT